MKNKLPIIKKIKQAAKRFLLMMLIISEFAFPVQIFAAGSTFETSLQTTGVSSIPTVPTNFTANAVSSSQIDLSWSPSTVNLYSVAGYRIFRDSVFLATTTTTSYSDIGLTELTSYSYTVEAFSTIFEMSGQSSTSTATTLSVSTPVTGGGSSSSGGNIILQISNLAVNAKTNQASISFNTNIPTQSRIQWGLTPDLEGGSLQSLFYGYDHALQINGLNQNTQYFARVTVTNNIGFSVAKDFVFNTLPIVIAEGPILNPSDFIAEDKTDHIKLSWNNPSDSRFDGVRIVRSDEFFPKDQNDGIPVYDGFGNNFKDKNVVAGKTYYYAIFAKGIDGQFSSGAITQARIAIPGETIVISTSTDPFANIKDSTNVDPRIKELTLNDFEFLQDGKLLPVIANRVAIDGSKNITIRLKYEKVPEILKTVAFTLQDPEISSKVFSFLLRINPGKTYYEATIGALGRSGKYSMSVVILDYQNQGMKRLNGTLAALVFAIPAIKFADDFDVFGFILFLIIILLILIMIMMIRRYVRKYIKHTKKFSY